MKSIYKHLQLSQLWTVVPMTMIMMMMITQLLQLACLHEKGVGELRF